VSDAADGGPVKVFAFLPRRSDLTSEEFHAHWRHPHGTLAKRIDTFTAYHQAHRVKVEGVSGLGSPHEGAAEMWFASLENAGALAENEIYADEVVPDEENFIDLGPDAFRVLTRERPIAERGFDRERRGVKLLQCLRRRGDLDPAEFKARLAAAGGEEELGVALGASRQVLCLALEETYGEEFVPYDGHMHRWQTVDPYDAIRELWWPDREAVRAAAASAAWGALFSSELVDGGASAAFLAEEHIVLEVQNPQPVEQK
jgi:hypothetical protein